MMVNCKINSYTDLPLSERGPLLVYAEVEGWIAGSEVKVLREHCTGKRILEVGSYKGKSACIIAPVAESLVCVDTFKADGSGQNQQEDFITLDDFKRNTKCFDNITVLIGDSFKIIPFSVPDNFFDVVFLDGLHWTWGVERDIITCWPKLKMNGVMLFHDTDWMSREGVGPLKAIKKYFTKEELQKNIDSTSISSVIKTKKYLKE